LPKVNTIKERANIKKHKDKNLIHNKYKDVQLLSNLGYNENFFMFLKNMHNIDYKYLKSNSLIGINKIKTENTIDNFIFNSIRYKNLGGIRLEIRGRLTRRLRADRSLYKLKWKGGLKNIESSFNRLSSTLYRGQFRSNVAYSVVNSKRPIGSFAVKG
jgi:hypothetical protein